MIRLSLAATEIGIAHGTALNQLCQKRFPLETVYNRKRHYVRLDDIARFIAG